MNSLPTQATRPPEPVYILRGHAAPINALCFLRQNLRLLSGDANGFVTLWDLTVKRPIAVWKAHADTILGIETWGSERFLTHGRDGKIRAWSISASEETTAGFSTSPPLEDAECERRAPWILFELVAGSVGFCSFSVCAFTPSRINENGPGFKASDADDEELQSAASDKQRQDAGASTADDKSQARTEQETQHDKQESFLLIAASGAKDSEIELRTLPDQRRVGIIPAPKAEGTPQTGMLMALKVFMSEARIIVIAGYENGQVVAFQQVYASADDQSAPQGKWSQMYSSRPHEQPVLSLDVNSSHDAFFSSGADAVVAKHWLGGNRSIKIAGTKHAGQQGLKTRSDGKVLATAGWDKMIRVYSAKTLTELAVLAWHKIGCYSVAFADVLAAGDNKEEDKGAAALVKSTTTVAMAREKKTRQTHWLAAGAKDGKISLWDIY